MCEDMRGSIGVSDYPPGYSAPPELVEISVSDFLRIPKTNEFLRTFGFILELRECDHPRWKMKYDTAPAPPQSLSQALEKEKEDLKTALEREEAKDAAMRSRM
jgi:hypothetical protein